MRKTTLAIVTLILIGFIVTVFSLGIAKGTLESLAGAFIGTLAGAAVIYGMQLRMEQTRFFQLVLGEIKEVYASNAAWEKVGAAWRRCEFRKAVGLASWTNDPCGTNGEAHIALHINTSDPQYAGIDWEGVIYKVDDHFCVASKPLHDYANWYSLLLDGLQNELLTSQHIQMLWR